MARSRTPAAVLVTLCFALAVAVAGCGGGATASESAQDTFAQILGHAPTGLAKTIADKGTIVVGDDPSYPPQSSYDKQTNQLVGFDVDVARRVAALLNLQVEFVNPNWDAVASGLKADRFDVWISSMMPTAQAQQTLAFSDPYYYTTAQVVVNRQQPQITTVAGLRGQAIGAGVQTTYQAYLQKVGGVNIKPYVADSDAIPDLVNGRLNGVLTSDLTARQAIADGQPLVVSTRSFFYEPLCFAQRQNEADLLAVLNWAVKTMHGDGSLTQLSQKWYAGHDATQPPPTSVPSFEQAMK